MHSSNANALEPFILYDFELEAFLIALPFVKIVDIVSFPIWNRRDLNSRLHENWAENVATALPWSVRVEQCVSLPNRIRYWLKLCVKAAPY